jgi:hypothetical protein
MGEVVQDWCETDYSGEMRSVQSEKEQEQEKEKGKGKGKEEPHALALDMDSYLSSHVSSER